MKDQALFETRLGGLFEAYANGAPIDVDAVGLARTIAGREQHVLQFMGRTFVRPRWLVPAVLVLLLLAALMAAAFIGSRLIQPSPVPYRDQFSTGAELARARTSALALALPDGRILVSGGEDGSPEGATAEVYEPSTGETTAVTGFPPLGDASGVVLPDGKAFVIAFTQNMTSSFAYLFEPETTSFRRLAIDTYANAPVYGVKPSLALLNDGRVLISGGKADVYEETIRREAVIFDPATKRFLATGSMAMPRLGHALLTLRDGRVLAVGGSSTAEIYDPATGAFSAVGELSLIRGDTIGCVLADGRVALFQVYRSEQSVADPPGPHPVEIFDPNAGTFSVAGETALAPRTATLLRDGRVLLTGTNYVPFNYAGPGTYYDRYQPWAAVYDPLTATTTSLPDPRAERAGAAALPDGRVVLVGGDAYPPLDDHHNTTGESFLVRWVEIFE